MTDKKRMYDLFLCDVEAPKRIKGYQLWQVACW